MAGPFDIFQSELQRVRSDPHKYINAASASAESPFPFDAFWSGTKLLTRPLAGAIVDFRVRRFSNRLIAFMIEEVVRRRGRRDYAAARLSFDIAVLAYVYHVTVQAGALQLPTSILTMMGRSLLRKIRGRDASFEAQITKHLDRQALPCIAKTVGAYLFSCLKSDYIKEAKCAALVKHYSHSEILHFKAVKPATPHPFGDHSIGECLIDRGNKSMCEYFDEDYHRRITEATRWDLGSTVHSYWRSPFSLLETSLKEEGW